MELRIWIIPILLGLAALCSYGLIATFEPSDNQILFRLAYAIGIALCLAGSVVAWIMGKPKA
jgi:hypothetical protein